MSKFKVGDEVVRTHPPSKLVVGEKVLTSEKGNELLDKSYLLLVSKIEKSIEDTNEKSSE